MKTVTIYMLSIVFGLAMTKQFSTYATFGSIEPEWVAATNVEQFPSLLMHGESYANACAPSEKSQLHIALTRSNVRNIEQAWDAVNTILCAPPSNKSRREITRLIANGVKGQFESTGSEAVVSELRPNGQIVDDIMARGRAWEATLQTSTRNIILQYFKDEACVRKVNLVFRNQRWLINEIGHACD